MSFLMLSTAQVAILAGITALAVITLFFLKLRHRRLVVGSALLWNRILDEQRANSLLEKLRRLASLLLTLAIALLIAVAIGEPRFGTADAGAESLIIILDTSASMETRNLSGETRWSNARNIAMDLITGSTPPAGYMVADTAGRVHTQLTSRRETVIAALDQMRPFPGEQRFPNLPVTGTAVYFISDGVAPPEVPDGITEISVFQPADNVAITAFQVRADPTSPSGYRAFLEITNYSPGTKDVPVLLSGSGDQRDAWRLEMASGDTWQGDVDLDGFRGGALRLRIEADGDALELDDTAYSYLPGRNSIRVDLVTTTRGGYLETLLELSPRVDLRVVDPPNFDDDPTVDAFVFEGFVPDEAPANPAVIFGAQNVDWLPVSSTRATDQVIASWEPDHPVMINVPVYDISIAEAPILDAMNWTVVAAADATPLVLVNDARVRQVLVVFALEDSDFAFHLGFPILIENALAWISGDALAENSSLGQVALPTEVDGVTTLDGTPVATTEQFGQTMIEALEPELYTATVQGRRMRIAANLLDRAASDVNATRLSSDTGANRGEQDGNELWIYMLVGAALLCTLEWWTYHSRITL